MVLISVICIAVVKLNYFHVIVSLLALFPGFTIVNHLQRYMGRSWSAPIGFYIHSPQELATGHKMCQKGNSWSLEGLLERETAIYNSLWAYLMLQYTVYLSINFIHGSFTISSFPLLATELN